MTGVLPPPNTRVQRTRSSPSALRSPLTRRPLGVTKARNGAIWLALMLLIPVRATASPDEALVRLYFPNLQLDRKTGERIESLSVKMTCGRFRGVAVIPADWSLSVSSPGSEQSSLRAEAGHGSTALWSLDELQGSIAVSGASESC